VRIDDVACQLPKKVNEIHFHLPGAGQLQSICIFAEKDG
jgi:hypothetical protein